MSVKIKIKGLAALLLAAVPAGTASADTAAFDRAMAPIVGEYMAIHAALAADKDKGIARAAKKIAKLSVKLEPGQVTGEHAAHYKHLPMQIKAAATKLAKAKGIAKQREAFKELSRPLAIRHSSSTPVAVSSSAARSTRSPGSSSPARMACRSRSGCSTRHTAS